MSIKALFESEINEGVTLKNTEKKLYKIQDMLEKLDMAGLQELVQDLQDKTGEPYTQVSQGVDELWAAVDTFNVSVENLKTTLRKGITK